MALRVRLDPIALDLRVKVDEAASVPAQQRAIARFAKAEIDKVDSANARALGRRVAHTVTVDGRKGGQLESVRPNGGVIIAEWDLFFEVLPWVAKTLRERSPRISGKYVRGHKVFADGAEIADLTKPPPAKEYTFLNVVPYARKIEIGKTQSGRAFVIQVPNRIYEGVARDSRARFGRLADISFTYRQSVGASRTAPAIIVRPKS